MTQEIARIARLQIEEDEQELAVLVDAVRRKLVRSVDWHEWIRRWPLPAVAGAFAVGWVLGRR